MALRAWEDFTPGGIVCLVRTVPDHAREMAAAVPDEIEYFVKPGSCLTHADPRVPAYDGLEHEAELAALVGAPLDNATADEAWGAIAGWAVLVDLTLRKEQQRLKAAGLPWGRAKAFRDSAPCSGFVQATRPQVLDWTVDLRVGGQKRQRFPVGAYVADPGTLLSRISRHLSLVPGDVVSLGSGAGVGPLGARDVVEIEAGPGGPSHVFHMHP